MNIAILKVVHAGPHCSIQDAGRPGHARFGVPASGPMDRLAFQAAHAAMGNAPGGAAVEVSLGGLVLECVEGAVGFSVAGGSFKVDVDGQGVASWGVAQIGPGQKLSLRPGAWGSWASLAFAGRLVCDTWLGAAATHALSGFGGGAVKAGQTLKVEEAERREARGTAITPPGFARLDRTVPVVMGPQDRFFTPEIRATFLEETFRIGDAYDRMGVRLAGPELEISGRLDMPSEPVLKGSIQVAGDGSATVLMADHQTTGGYPKIATVPDFALDAFAQSRSGDPLRFVRMAPDAALDSHRERHAQRAAFLDALAQTAGSLSERLAKMNLIGGVTDGEA